MTPSDRILALLSDHGADFRVLEHPAARSSAEAAAARGTPLPIGGKSLVMKLDRGIGFALLVVGGDRQLDGRKLRSHLRVRRYRFATPGELLQHTGLAPGCVPPFGRPVFELPLYVDADRADLPQIAFSLGSHTRSVIMDTAAWLAAARPAEIFPLSKPTGG